MFCFTKKLYKSVMIFITNMPNYGVSTGNHIVMKPIRQISYHFQKCCVVKRIRYENRAELLVSDGNAKPIPYEKHNGVKPKSLLNGVPYVPYVPTCPTCSTCPTCPACPRAQVYFTDQKMKKWKLCTHTFLRVLILILTLILQFLSKNVDFNRHSVKRRRL